MVDAAKAFCPGCGNSLVEEKKRTTVSEFDMSNETVQLGETMYNQMLSDMGLNISKSPNREEKRVETIAPAAAPAPGPAATKPVKPVAVPEKAGGSRKIWIVLAAVVGALVLLVILIIVAAAAILYFR